MTLQLGVIKKVKDLGKDLRTLQVGGINVVKELG